MKSRLNSREMWARAALLLFSLFVSAVLFEIIARFYGAPIIVNVRGEYKIDIFQHDALLGYKMIPSLDLLPVEEGEGVILATNPQGYRSPEYSLQKPPGTNRIVLLGDSYGYGLGLPYEKTLAALLDKKLPETEVINLSIPGFNTTQELLALQRDGLPFDPDLVLVLFCANDPRGNVCTFAKHNRIPYFLLNEQDSLELHGVPVPEEKFSLERESFWGKALNKSAAYRLIQYRLSPFFQRREKGGVSDLMTEWRKAVPLTTGFREGRLLTRRLVSEIGRNAGEAGARTIVISAITKMQIEHKGSTRTVERMIAEDAETDPNIVWIELFDIFEEESRKEELWLASNDHWNERGNRIAAEAVLEAIQRHSLLSELKGTPPIHPAMGTDIPPNQ